MPGLLGLPPELLENIAQHLLDWDDRAHLASLRLSCRPIEAAIRRSFRLGRFATASISKPTDGNIQEFCAIAQIPDLAKSINHFAIHCADDGSSDYGARNRTQHRDAAHSSNNGHELLWPNGADRLVPTALVSHEEALLAAFLATKNVTELIFTDHYWSNSTTEGNEPEHRDLPARRPISRQAERRTLYDFVCDITSTFNLIMSLVAQVGLAPTRITTSSLPGANLVTGLSSAIGLVTYKQALLQLEGLDLVFVDESRDELGTVEAAGALIGRQLSECLDSLPVLKVLHLSFNGSKIGLVSWGVFSQGPVLPALRHLILFNCKVAVKDFSQFVLKHCNTLERLAMAMLDLEDGNLENIRRFLGGLRRFPRIKHLNLMVLRLDENVIGFPSASQAIGVDLEDEEDYVWISTPDHAYVLLEGTKEIEDGLMTMAECITFL